MAPPILSPVDAVAPLFGLERGRLLGLLRDLRDEDWQRATRCPGWTVLGLACHLLGDDLGLLSRRRDDYMGTPSLPALTETGFIDWLDELQDEWVHAARRVSPRLVAELLEWTGLRLTQVMGIEQLSDLSSRVSWAGPGPMPVWLDQLRELSEYWIHRQQLHEELGRPCDFDPLLLGPILVGLRWAYPYRLSQTDLPSGAAIEIVVGAPIDEQWTLVSKDGLWDFSGYQGQPVIAQARFSGDQLWRLLTNNLVGGPARLDVSGDERAVAVILTTRAVIGHPK